MNILLAGGAGYIGSHTCIELISAGHTVRKKLLKELRRL